MHGETGPGSFPEIHQEPVRIDEVKGFDKTKTAVFQTQRADTTSIESAFISQIKYQSHHLAWLAWTASPQSPSSLAKASSPDSS